MFQRPINPNYFITIENHGDNAGVIHSYMPDQFSIRVASDWEPTLANMMSENRALLAGRIAGYLPFDKRLTGQIWRSSEPLDFSVQLQFDAINDVKQDVRDPVRDLMMWASPIREGMFAIKAPGPTILNQNNRISVLIGNHMWLPSVILPSVDVTWYMAADIDGGQLIAADVTLQIRTFFTPDRNDIQAMFIG